MYCNIVDTDRDIYYIYTLNIHKPSEEAMYVNVKGHMDN